MLKSLNFYNGIFNYTLDLSKTQNGAKSLEKVSEYTRSSIFIEKDRHGSTLVLEAMRELQSVLLREKFEFDQKYHGCSWDIDILVPGGILSYSVEISSRGEIRKEKVILPSKKKSIDLNEVELICTGIGYDEEKPRSLEWWMRKRVSGALAACTVFEYPFKEDWAGYLKNFWENLEIIIFNDEITACMRNRAAYCVYDHDIMDFMTHSEILSLYAEYQTCNTFGKTIMINDFATYEDKGGYPNGYESQLVAFTNRIEYANNTKDTCVNLWSYFENDPCISLKDLERTYGTMGKENRCNIPLYWVQ
ncbi:hypothetical protein [Actinomyces vulturis]|uniref:hypothetical protein n=1 Tax=Actinomyces vulturis TaxID=1857645 RepID=UPI00083541D7|nr:hypothetical protein [Actinomyces vulturis]